MKDPLGVNRGHCKDCGEDECKDYKVQKNTDLCRYCGCYPVKHVKIRSEEKLLTKAQTAEEQAHQSRLNADEKIPHWVSLPMKNSPIGCRFTRKIPSLGDEKFLLGHNPVTENSSAPPESNLTM